MTAEGRESESHHCTTFPIHRQSRTHVRDVHIPVNTSRVRLGAKSSGIPIVVSTAAFIRQNQAHSLIKLSLRPSISTKRKVFSDPGHVRGGERFP